MSFYMKKNPTYFNYFHLLHQQQGAVMARLHITFFKAHHDLGLIYLFYLLYCSVLYCINIYIHIACMLFYTRHKIFPLTSEIKTDTKNNHQGIYLKKKD